MNDNENRELSLDEIAQYYRDKDDDISLEYSAIEPMVKIAPHRDEEENQVNEESTDSAPDTKRGKLKFILISGGVAVFILLAGFISGFMVPKAEEDINFALEKMHTSSQKYINAQENLTKLETEKTEIEEQIETNQASITAITDFESNTGELKTKLNVLTDELDGLNKEIGIHEENISKIEKNISDKSKVKYSLTPGIYTVGENINTGNYNISGNGIISISDSAGNLKVNTVLQENDFSVEVFEGDIIKLETKASFSPVEE